MKYFIVIAVALLSISCSAIGIKAPPSVCDSMTGGESVLCDLSSKANINLETTGDFIMVGYMRLIKEDVVSRSDVLLFLRSIEEVIHTDDLSVGALKQLVFEAVDEYPELMLTMRYLGYLDGPQLLTPTDIDMLDSWLDNQFAILIR